MSGLALNAVNLLVGVLIGVGGVVALFSRLDRTGESGCFYQLLLTVIGVVLVVIVLGMIAS